MHSLFCSSSHDSIACRLLEQILGPMMLLMGVNPRISTSTTATLIALTSSSVAVSFVIGGIVPWSYALYFFLVCLCGALCLKRKIDAYVKRTGRASLLIFVLACIILFATVGCIFLMLQRLAQKDWCFDGMNKFCTVSKNGGCPDRMLEELEETPFWEL
jgi:ABC-type Na+ efflux pump permease subunit